jgi:hypothetical protein
MEGANTRLVAMQRKRATTQQRLERAKVKTEVHVTDMKSVDTMIVDTMLLHPNLPTIHRILV